MKIDKMDKEYQAESDLRTLIEYQKIMKDKPRHAAAMKKHKEQMMALKAVSETKGM